MSESTPSPEDFQAALAETDAELEAARNKPSVALIQARSAIAVSLITGVLAFGPAVVNRSDPVVDNCVEQRADAIELVLETGVWVDLPEDQSEAEKQCDINEYVVEWQKQNPDYKPPVQTPAPQPSPTP